MQLLAKGLEKSDGKWLTYLGPTTHMEDPDEAPSSWFLPGQALAIAAIRGLNQQVG